jgi:5-oxoprolinase (ATP-hydrolysing)
LPKVIGFDMGGTSTDVSRYDGRFQRRYEMEIEGGTAAGRLRIRAPMLAVETVAAGGGSICGFDTIKPFVGPTSAGAHPGPACYGNGGPLCVTDVNYCLGRVLQDNFPFPLDRVAVEFRLDELRREINRTTGRQYGREELASGFVDIANEHMVAAIRRISTRQGYDPREYALLSFGGAGGQHACAVARSLGMNQLLLPARAGALSAYGIGMATVERFSERSVDEPLDPAALEAIEDWKTVQEASLRTELLRAGNLEETLRPGSLILELRYEGQDSTIPIQEPPDQDWRRAFEVGHRQLYGFAFPGRQVEIHAARLQVGTLPHGFDRDIPTHAGPTPTRAGNDESKGPYARAHVCLGGKIIETPVLRRDQLKPGEQIDGPAIVLDATSTFLIEPAWHGDVLESGDIHLTLSEQTKPGELTPSSSPLMRPRESTSSSFGKEGVRASRTSEEKEGEEVRQTTCDPITLELFNNRFVEIAEQMGETLQRTALSTNVKDRLDFSCALFDAKGDLVANAPHIPVHLGAMGECVKCLLEDVAGHGGGPPLRKGDVFITNDPYRGGTHLPDVTVITPAFNETGERVLFFTASRAHHAEIGGISPGSMPPRSRNLAEEGVLIRAMRLVESGEKAGAIALANGGQTAVIPEAHLHEGSLRSLLTKGPYPSRNVGVNLADIQAQAAANRCGARLLGELVQQHGLKTVQAYMNYIRSAAEQKMRSTLRGLDPGEHTFVDHLDDQTPIAVKITIAGDSAVVDFTGTGDVHPGNLNATLPIVRSCVLYCFRCLIADDIPLNAGVLAPLRIVVPEGILNPPMHRDPAYCAAVAGGNVETSQRIVDAIFGALGVVAASQGSMNNLTFGNERFGYYETICGGAGAGPDFDGADAVHTHMTNTRLTDPEVLEARYPVRLRRFAIRSGSGGGGRQHGGDGVIREIEVLEPLEVSLLTQCRVRAPYGLAGGSDGKPGRNRLRRSNSGETEILAPITQFSVSSGDVLTIETPGGGGYGRG